MGSFRIYDIPVAFYRFGVPRSPYCDALRPQLDSGYEVTRDGTDYASRRRYYWSRRIDEWVDRK